MLNVWMLREWTQQARSFGEIGDSDAPHGSVHRRRFQVQFRKLINCYGPGEMPEGEVNFLPLDAFRLLLAVPCRYFKIRSCCCPFSCHLFSLT